MIKRMFIINPPPIFAFIWGIVKLFLNDVITAKVKVINKNYQEVLL